MKRRCEFALYIFPVTHIHGGFPIPVIGRHWVGVGVGVGVKKMSAWKERESAIYWSLTTYQGLGLHYVVTLGDDPAKWVISIRQMRKARLTEGSCPISGRIGIQT